MCVHRSSSKRLGACLVFTRLYRIFREEESLVDRFAMEVLHHLLYALRLCEPDVSQQQDTKIQAEEAINHWKKILIKSTILREASSIRRGFPGLEEAPSFSMVCDWLFSQFGSREASYTHKCMELFFEMIHVISSK